MIRSKEKKATCFCLFVSLIFPTRPSSFSVLQNILLELRVLFSLKVPLGLESDSASWERARMSYSYRSFTTTTKLLCLIAASKRLTLFGCHTAARLLSACWSYCFYISCLMRQSWTIICFLFLIRSPRQFTQTSKPNQVSCVDYALSLILVRLSVDSWSKFINL